MLLSPPMRLLSLYNLLPSIALLTGSLIPFSVELRAEETAGTGNNTPIPATAPAAGFTFPSEIDTSQLIDLIGDLVGASVHYDPQKISGKIRLDIRRTVSNSEAWSIFNQVLLAHGLTTVVAGSPPIIHVVPTAEAESSGLIFTNAKDAEAISPPPGYVTLILEVHHIAPDSAIQTLSTMLGQRAQAKVVIRDTTRLVLSGDRERVLAAERIIASIDRPGNALSIQTYQPMFASGSKLQTSLAAAWGAAAKVSGRKIELEVQVLPDGQRLLLLATSDSMPDILKLLGNLDRAEPTITTTYRFEHFRLDDVAQLLEQLLVGSEDKVRMVRDRLTGSLMVTATETQHAHILELVRTLEAAPAGSRQNLRTFIIKHRKASELTAVLRELTSNGAIKGSSDAPIANGTVGQTPSGSTTSASAPLPTVATGSGSGSAQGESSFTVDPHTNAIIVLGHPRFIDQVATLIERLDKRQPQVEIEITLVSMSDSDSLALSTEWARISNKGEHNFTFSQLFGLSKQDGTTVVDRSSAGTGLTSMVISPGNYAVLAQALSTINTGRNVVRSRAVVENSAEATIDAVLQQPIANINTNNNIASTTFGGTSDAGTQIKIKPLIGAADQVQLTFTVSQSTFVGQSTTVEGGGVIPPPKRQDALASTVSIPDGHVIALGGLTNDSSSKATTGLPWLSSIPVIGFLFGSKSRDTSSSRFYLFIRADVLRHPEFEDLKYRMSAPAQAAGLKTQEGPQLKPHFIK